MCSDCASAAPPWHCSLAVPCCAVLCCAVLCCAVHGQQLPGGNQMGLHGPQHQSGTKAQHSLSLSAATHPVFLALTTVLLPSAWFTSFQTIASPWPCCCTRHTTALALS